MIDKLLHKTKLTRNTFEITSFIINITRKHANAMEKNQNHRKMKENICRKKFFRHVKLNIENHTKVGQH